MQMPQWGPELSVGNPRIDEQHQRLIALGSQAIGLLEAPDTDPAGFHQVLNDIADLTRRHFDTEEALLEINHCPGLASHRAAHDRYLERLTDILLAGSDGCTDRLGLARFIHELVTVHVLEADLPEKAWMREPGWH